MGFRFRRSVRLLPGVRLNLSGSGASVSLGPKGFRYTVGPKGTRVTGGIPGSGLSWTQYTPYSQPRSTNAGAPAHIIQSETGSLVADPIDPSLTAIESAPAEQINTFSASELAPILNSANRRVRLAPIVQVASVLVFVATLLQANQLAMGLSALYATVMVPIGIFLDRYRRSVKIAYEPRGATSQIAEALRDSFSDLMSSHMIWRVRAEGGTADWKRNAGATKLSQRKKATVQFGKPDCVRGNSLFPTLRLGSDEIYLLPDAALVIVRGSVAAVHYRNLKVSNSVVKFIEEEGVPADAPIVGQTWRYVNKSGGPDRRFSFNEQLPICLYGELSLQSEGGLNTKIQCSNPSALERLCAVVDVLHRSNTELPKAITYVRTAKWWPTAIFLLSVLVLGGGLIAFFSKDFIQLPLQPTQVSKLPEQRQQTVPAEKPRTNVQVNRTEQSRSSEGKAGIPGPLIIYPPAVESRTSSPPATQLENATPIPGTIPLPRPRPKAASGLQKKNAAE